MTKICKSKVLSTKWNMFSWIEHNLLLQTRGMKTALEPSRYIWKLVRAILSEWSKQLLKKKKKEKRKREIGYRGTYLRGLGHGISLPKVSIYIINHARKIFTFQVKLRSHLWSECCYMRLLNLINDSENKMTAPECVYAIVYVCARERIQTQKRKSIEVWNKLCNLNPCITRHIFCNVATLKF